MNRKKIVFIAAFSLISESCLVRNYKANKLPRQVYYPGAENIS